jgi:hypothetical protein
MVWRPTTQATNSALVANQKPLTIAVDSSGVYWKNQGTSAPGDPGTNAHDATLVRAGLDGSNPTALATGLSAGATSMVLDATSLYYIEEDKIIRICK